MKASYKTQKHAREQKQAIPTAGRTKNEGFMIAL